MARLRRPSLEGDEPIGGLTTPPPLPSDQIIDPGMGGTGFPFSKPSGETYADTVLRHAAQPPGEPVNNPLGDRVTLPGWDPSRTDDDPKQVFGRFAQAWTNSGKPWNADAVRAFLAQDPRWESTGSATDPHIRVKQGELDKWKPGTSVYQDVIRDAGGASAPQFINAGDGGALGAPGPAGTNLPPHALNIRPRSSLDFGWNTTAGQPRRFSDQTRQAVQDIIDRLAGGNLQKNQQLYQLVFGGGT